MKGKSQTVDEAIRIEAYLLSEKAGHPSGTERYFWEQAQGIVHARTVAVAVAVKKAAAKKKKPVAKSPVKAKAETKPKVEAAPKAATATKTVAKPKAVKKPAAVNGANGKDRQLSLDGGVTAAARNRPLKK